MVVQPVKGMRFADGELVPLERILDIRVARALGFVVIDIDDCNGADNYWLSRDSVHPALDKTGESRALPRYTTEIQHAWQAVEHMRKLCYSLSLEELRHRNSWRATFVQHAAGSAGLEFRGYNDTPETAICYGVLLALEEVE